MGDGVTVEPGKTRDSFFEQRQMNDSHDPRLVVKNQTTRPYFTRKDIEQPYYDVSDPALRLSPQTPPESFWVRASYDGVPLLMGQVVLAPKSKDNDVDRPMEVIPSLSVAIWPAAGIIPLTEKSFMVSVEARNDEQRGLSGTARLELPEGWLSEPRSAAFSFSHAGEVKIFSFRVTPAALAQKSYTLKAVAEAANGTTSEGFRAVGYAGTDTYEYVRLGDIPDSWRGCEGGSGIEGGISAGNRGRGSGVTGEFRRACDDVDRGRYRWRQAFRI